MSGLIPWLRSLSIVMVVASSSASVLAADKLWVEYPGNDGPGRGKHIVLISGDEEYRSEEALPQLGKILSQHHGFRCTVLFAIHPEKQTIAPDVRNNIPGLEALATADLMILALRFRDLPDEQMKHIVDYVESGRPIMGLRTATHSFNIESSPTYARYSWANKEWDGGFGRQVLGETWVNHHGAHGKQSTRGRLVPDQREHPILRGIDDGAIWGPTDVYGVKQPLPGDSEPLVLGEVVEGMKPEDPAVQGKQNDPMMPIAWTRTYTGSDGKKARVFTTTMGASQDLLNEPFRRLLVNACYWCLGLEQHITPQSSVAIVGDYAPSPFRFNGARADVRPADHELR